MSAHKIINIIVQIDATKISVTTKTLNGETVDGYDSRTEDNAHGFSVYYLPELPGIPVFTPSQVEHIQEEYDGLQEANMQNLFTA
jgi:hypothetical protein